MAPYETPFDSRCLNALYRLSWLLIQPCYWSLNRMISCCVSTSGDLSTRGEDPCYERFVYLVVLIPTYLIIFLIFTPTALLGLCSWIILQRYRHPFIYSYYESQCILEDWTDISTRQCFRIGSANISLLPEAIARMNNLECTYWRAKEMAHRLANSQLRPRPKIFIESPSDNELARSSSLYNHMQNHYQYSDVVLTNMENHTSKVHSPDCEDVHIVYNSGYTNNHINGTNSTVRNGGIVKNSQTYDSIRSDTTQDSAYVVNSRMKKSPSAPSMPDGIRQPSRSSTHSEFQGSDFMPMDSNPSISLNACGLSLSEDQSNGDFSPTLAKEDSRTFNEGFSRCQHSVEINFPSQIDFMCFQEVYEPSSAKAFIKKIHPWFSHIIYDVGINSWDSNLFMLNSGLVVASRYPILDADFKYFTHCAREDKAICKGLLMTKVRLGKTRDRQRIVGYIAVTQLQAGRDKSFIRLNQMNKITLWLQEFKKKTLCVSDPEDIIAFDVLTGDFNFDNMSPGDMGNWSHPLLSEYSDPCHVTAGLDQTWTVGTKLYQEMLYEDEVAMPEGLQRLLEDHTRRGIFLEDIEPCSLSDSSIPSSSRDFQRYKGNGRRRTDFLLFNNQYTNCKQVCEEYYFVSQFATLSDHIPVVMTCSCTEVPDCSHAGNETHGVTAINSEYNHTNPHLQDIEDIDEAISNSDSQQVDDDMKDVRIAITYESTV